MKTNKFAIWAPLIAVSLLTSMLVTGCKVDLGGKDAEKDKKEKEEVAIPVEVAKIGRGPITASFHGSATLEADEEATVVAKSGGIVEAIQVEEGQVVTSGQVLASLDADKLRLEVARAQANYDKLKNEYERNQVMFDKNLVSSDTFERAKFELAQQNAELDLAKLALRDTAIRAPIGGVISERMIKVGNMIPVNQAAFRITQFDPLLAVLHVPERDMIKIRVGQPARLHVDVYAEEVFEGKVDRISPVVDAGTGTVKVTVEMQASGQRLKPGMFGRVSILYDRHENALLLPKDALISEDAEQSVFVVKEGKASKIAVRTGFINSHYIEVLQGLNEGDEVVTTGQATLKDGAKVEVVTTAAKDDKQP